MKQMDEALEALKSVSGVLLDELRGYIEPYAAALPDAGFWL